MNKRNAISRAICFIAIYLTLYFAPIAAIYSTDRMPYPMDNFCFSFPQLMFPFDITFWGFHSLESHTAFFVSVLYLISLAWLFSLLTRFVQKFRWVVLFAFCFSVVSVVALNLILLAMGVFGVSVEPKMP
jgi:hypothetical protein